MFLLLFLFSIFVSNKFDMIQLGKYNTLRIVKDLEFGLYLDGGEKGEILLPRKYVPSSYEIGD